MNDFTKEELEHIAILFKFTEVAYPDYKLNEDLWVKVETMIDNYCEHQWRSSAINAIYCVYCQKHVEYGE